MPDHAGKRDLFLDQGMLKDRHGKPIHGVELFRLALIDDLLQRGLRITVAADHSWRHIIDTHFPDPNHRPRLLCPASIVHGTVANGIAAALLASTAERPYHAAVFGDARRSLRPAIRIARALNIADRFLIFAHRHPTTRTARAVASARIPVLAVSQDVAQHFQSAGVSELAVHYGLPNTHAFHPPHAPRDNSTTTRFILLGRMPNHFKGHDTAIAAFRDLPEATKEHAELHLASFITPTTIDEPNIHPHPWIPKHQVPNLLRTMDVMLCPSRNETFSQAIVQGMLTELPVIATPLPVFTEKLDNGAGIIASTTHDFTAAMTTLARNPNTRREMGRIGRRTALERYVWDTDSFLDRYLFPSAQFGHA